MVMQALALTFSMLLAAIDPKAAQAALHQAHALCTAEAGALWNHRLCGPMMFVDPQTNEAVGSTDGINLVPLTLPKDLQIANTAVEFQGQRWTMFMFPLPDDPKKRAVELMHEPFHRIQPEIHLTGGPDLGMNGHLETEGGRIWLRGELRALDRALATSGTARKSALADALVMRSYRHELFAGSAEQERGVEILESLAESTGIDAGLAPADRIPFARGDVAMVERSDHDVRMFPFATGVAYVELLDAIAPKWRAGITNESDLATLAAKAYGIALSQPAKAQAQEALARYDGKKILAQEHARALRIAQINAHYRTEFVSGTTLTLPMKKFAITFNPSKVEQFLTNGSVYHTLMLSDGWGSLKVTGGDALVPTAFDRCVLQLPSNITGPVIQGPGWTLTLADGYTIVPDTARSGSFTVEKRS